MYDDHEIINDWSGPVSDPRYIKGKLSPYACACVCIVLIYMCVCVCMYVCVCVHVLAMKYYDYFIHSRNPGPFPWSHTDYDYSFDVGQASFFVLDTVSCHTIAHTHTHTHTHNTHKSCIFLTFVCVLFHAFSLSLSLSHT